ncbi:hypothetical protein SPOG_00942 [Schizosaccharomyces cryophilus OY26]|uniref:Uncharacterized protein n=1 Tax=Schizosaccharomyces cryophilus (strain OY26 / ATCC MYA-4695 / CBS 11777 / NBRC 106824 / NRRL Y48691) TaxID=653667 RepID=S9X8N0_SCHCR|nr:uncharacterized protein SPOG_00942 [Schizosaccharomyces cryophilus OY26]EPY50181.1 hypothetical protein SPOG_00942 [Schizosaccharomyces cryophilus OY26]
MPNVKVQYHKEDMEMMSREERPSESRSELEWRKTETCRHQVDENIEAEGNIRRKWGKRGVKNNSNKNDESQKMGQRGKIRQKK